MYLTNDPGKIKSLVAGGTDKVRIFASTYSLYELEIALQYAESLPLARASKSLRKQLGIEIRRKKKALRFISASDQVEAALNNAQRVIRQFKESLGG